VSADRSPVGLVLGSHMVPERIARTAQLAERLGYGELWFSEDCFFAGAPSGVTAALDATERLPIGLGVVAAMTRHPALLAMEIATMSRLHRGRIWPGVGLGVPLWLEQMGLRPKSSLTALRECVTCLRRLLDGEELSYAGKYFHFDQVVLTHKPEERLPIYMGLVNEKGLLLSGEIADGTVLSVLSGTEYIRWAREKVRAGAEAAGRTGNHRLVTYVLYSVDGDSRTAKEAVRDVTAFYLEAMPDNALSEIYGVQADLREMLGQGGAQAVAREMPDQWLEDLAIAGDPDECAAKIQAFLDAGSDSVNLWLFPLERGEEVAELTAREVLPRVG